MANIQSRSGDQQNDLEFAAGQPVQAEDAAPGNILIVDDGRLNRLKLTKAVARLGHRSVASENGREALQKLQSDDFDLILLDIDMPVMDGFEVLTILRQSDDLRYIPVIVISALEDMDDIVKAIKLGAADFLPKNFNATLLDARVNACLANKRLRDNELEMLNFVHRLTDAAGELDSEGFNPRESGVLDIAKRPDGIGRLAHVLLNKSIAVYNRHITYQQQLKTLAGTLMLLFIGGSLGLRPALAILAAVEVPNPLGTAFYTLAATALFSFIIALLMKQRWPKLNLRTFGVFLIWSFLWGVFPHTLIFYAAEQMSGVMISIIMTLEAIIVFTMSAALKLEILTVRRFFGLSLGIVSILAILSPSMDNSAGSYNILWVLVAMGIPLSLATSTILISSRIPTDCGPVAATTLVYAIAAGLLLFINLLTDTFQYFSYPFGRFEIMITTFGFVQAAGSVMIVVLIRYAGSVFASQKSYTVAIAGIVWSIVLLNESINLIGIVGLLAALVGIYLVAQKAKREELLKAFPHQERNTA